MPNTIRRRLRLLQLKTRLWSQGLDVKFRNARKQGKYLLGVKEGTFILDSKALSKKHDTK